MYPIETSFCRRCSPDAKKPALALRLVFADHKERLVSDVTPADVGLLRDFFAGRTVSSDGVESPLKNALPRLRQILGFTPSATNAPAVKP